MTRSPTRPRLATLALAALLASAALPPLAFAQDERARGMLEDAREALQKGDANAARVELMNALQRDPEFAEARALLGELQLALGKYIEAEKELRRAYATAPNDRTEILLATVLLRQESFLDAVGILHTDQGTEEERLQKVLLKAEGLVGLGRVGEADGLLREVLERAPLNAPAHFAMARVMLARGDVDGVVQSLRTATEIDPTFTEAFLVLARVERNRGRAQAALEALQAAKALDPNNPQVRIEEAESLLSANRLPEAEAVITELARAAPDLPMVGYATAKLRLLQGRIADADNAFNQVEDQLRTFAPALLVGALIRAQSDPPQFAAAQDALGRYLAGDPGNVTVRRLQAEVMMRQDRTDDAIRLLQEGLQLKPDEETLKVSLASALTRQNRFGEAAEIYEQLASEGGAVASEARTSLALMSAALGVAPASLSGLRPSSSDSGPALVGVLDMMRAGQFPQALARVDQLIAADAENAVLKHYRAGLLAVLGRRDEARATWEEAVARDPDFAAALDGLAQLDIAGGNVEAGIARLKNAAERAEGNVTIGLRYVRVLIGQGQLDAARAFLNQRAILPGRSGTPYRLALIELEAGTERIDEAVRVAQPLREMASDQPDSAARGAALLALAGRGRDARELLNGMPATRQTGTALLLRAQLERADGDAAAAARTLTAARAVLPENIDIARELIALRITEGDIPAAQAVAAELKARDEVLGTRLEAAILTAQQKPAEAVTLLTDAQSRLRSGLIAADLYQLRRQLGQDDDALREAQAWVDDNPQDGNMHILYGTALLERGDVQGAADYLERALPLVPRNAVLLNNLAWVRGELNRPGAVELARAALQVAPDNPDIADTLGWLLTRNGQAEEGARILRVALERAPDNRDTMYHLAFALNEQGKRDEAKEQLRQALEGDTPFARREAAQQLLAALGN